jgi:hypothetical protein
MNLIIFGGGFISFFFLLRLLMLSFGEASDIEISGLGLPDFFSSAAELSWMLLMCGAEHWPHCELSRDGFFFSRFSAAAASTVQFGDSDCSEAV